MEGGSTDEKHFTFFSKRRATKTFFLLCSTWVEVAAVQFLDSFAFVKKQVQKLTGSLLFMEFHYPDLFLRNV